MRGRRRTPRLAGARQPPVMRCNNHRMPRQDLVGLIIAGLALATSRRMRAYVGRARSRPADRRAAGRTEL